MSNNIFKSFDDNNVNNLMNKKEVQDIINDPKTQNIINKNEFNQFKEKYKDKSNDEILKDAHEYSQKLKSQLGEKEFNKKLNEIKKFEMFLNKDQKNKLNEFLNKIK
ncbi:hypothetical protein JYG23_06355 [Sedimentibacter sp. zth1]|uniref:hypothetical protein n=1 Tax=Sedimentibacter sp. zth1 TaxID=2816908 RepID=UPI001A92FB18|nr:hypothetical protein [Sedimentibacter sp. zth1]QSX07007.1 hypothetical protein JYG23_06355 [Sedimentibacter sp. zth1]